MYPWCAGILFIDFLFFFFFKQKTAYELRISDWSSDVCSSDLSSWSPLLMAGSAATRTMAPRDGRTAGLAGVRAAAARAALPALQIGRASCRERVCQYV